MINDFNIDWYSLTKADMYTIIKQTEEQNDKLRELFNGWRYCHNTMRNSPRHENCPLFRETDDYSDYHNWCRLDELMTELGIEVEE